MEKFSALKVYSFIFSVVDTGDKLLYSNIFTNFRKIRVAPKGYLGPRGKTDL